MAMEEKAVYGLVDPRDGRLRYVGSSRVPTMRYQAHTYGGDPTTKDWVAELKAEGLRPDLRILAESCVDWRGRETQTIRENPDLLNKADYVGGTPREDYSAPIATNLRAFRELHGLSQSELARRAGITASAVSNYEAAKRTPSLESVAKMGDALGEPLSVFLPGLVEGIEKARAAHRGREGSNDGDSY